MHRVIVQAVQHQHLRARQKSAVQLKARVLRRGADQDDGAVLDIGQERVLLGFVEAVDLVDEQQRSPPLLTPDARLFEHLLQVSDTGKDRGDLLEGQSRFARQQPGYGGLAGPRRPPQDDRRDTACSQHPGDHPIGADEVILSDDVRQLLRAQPIRQRAGRVLAEAGGVEQVGHQPPMASFRTRPPRLMVKRHMLPLSPSAALRESTLAILAPFTSSRISPGLKKRAAGALSTL